MKRINDHNSIMNQYLAELRDIHVQHDRMRFRTNLERIGSVMAYEISKSFEYHDVSVTTPLATANVSLSKGDLVVATVLRAGMPFLQGFMKIFDHAEAAFIGAARGKVKEDHSFDVNLNYVATPDLTNKTLILCDPMLATGQSLVQACQALLLHGIPKQIHLACVIASPEGVSYVESHLPQAQLWIASLDEKLNDHAYIVPGLGDAGDLSFGEKL